MTSEAKLTTKIGGIDFEVELQIPCLDEILTPKTKNENIDKLPLLIPYPSVPLVDIMPIVPVDNNKELKKTQI